MDIKDRVAVITGAGGMGCGRAIAECLAREGAIVVVSDIDENGGQGTIRRIEMAGGTACFRRADVRRWALFVRRAAMMPGPPLHPHRQWLAYPPDCFPRIWYSARPYSAMERVGQAGSRYLALVDTCEHAASDRKYTP